MPINADPSQMMSGVSNTVNNAIGPAASIVKVILAIIVIAVLLIVIISKFKYNTKVLLIRQRKGGTEYVLTKAHRDYVKNVYVIKMKGFEKPRTRKLPLPPDGELVAKQGKNDLIAVRELPTGELRYCTHPDVSEVTFKTLSSDYRQFDLLDEEETKKRITANSFWKDHGGAIVQVAGIALIFILSLMLLDKFQDVSAAASMIVAEMNQLSCAQVIG